MGTLKVDGGFRASGTSFFTKANDASGTAFQWPALVVGGEYTTAHLELDNNELMAKSDATTPTTLYLNADGGLVSIGVGGLTVDGTITGSLNGNATTANGVKPEWSGSIAWADTGWICAWSNDGTKIKALNKSSFAPASHTHSYLPLSGGTMTGALNFKNSTWNLLGDDVYFGDNDIAGAFCIKGANGTTNLRMVQHNGTAAGTISFDGTNFNISNYIVGTISNADTLDGYHADSFASASNAWRYGGLTGDANNYIFNGAWRTLDSVANVPVGNGHLWTFNGDGAGNTCVQFSGTYNMSNIYYRSKWYGNGWTNWYTLLSSNNYNSYSPTLTGGGASGTWGINISGNAASASYLASPLHKYGGLTGKPCYPCFARITVTDTYTSRPGVIILGSRDRCLCKLQVRFAGENSTDPSTLYLYHESGDSYYGIFAVKAGTSTWDLYYTKSQDWDNITVHQYFSSDFSISFPGGYITSIPSNRVASVPLPNRGTVPYGNSKPTHEDFAGMIYYQLI